MNPYNVLFAVFDCFLTYVTVSYLFSAFSDKIRIRWYHIFSIILTFCATAFFENAILSVSATLISAFIISLAYKFKWYISAFLTFTAVAVQILAEMLTGIFMMTVFSMNFAETVSGIPYFAGLIISRFLGYVVAYIIKTARQNVYFNKFDGRWILVFTLPVASVFISITLLSYIGGFNENSGILALVGILTLVVSNILIFFFLDTMNEAILNKEKLVLSETLIAKQEERYKELLKSNDEIRRLRHDHKNFLLGVIAQIENGDTETLKEKLQSQLDGQNEKNIVNSGNSILDIIIDSKLKIAEKYNISFEYNFYRISTMNFESTDFSVLIGNALDNAIEGAKSVQGEKVIKISVSANDGQMIFSITNPTNNKININNLATTKNDGDNHGYGIYSMKRIAERYNGDVVFFSTDDTFKTVIYLKNTNET